MFRRGIAQGWLHLPSEQFSLWTRYHGIDFQVILPENVKGRGSGLVAQAPLDGELSVLLKVPSDLRLSKERVFDHAKADQALRQVLDRLGEYGRTSRGALLTFLLMQASLANPDRTLHRGVSSPFVIYIRSLPLELLPTFWTSTERTLIAGTTLASALAVKLKSLAREYDLLCASAATTQWFETVGGQLELEDWYVVDAMYRSRALDFPGIGHCMVPCIDIANHASGDATVGFYENDRDGNPVLVIRDGKSVATGDEVTITYGDEKGACEMLFSYGFIEDGMETARNLFLGLETGDNDPLGDAKKTAADCPPGFKLVDTGNGKIEWVGDYIYMLIADDDQQRLRFKIARTLNGEEEMQACWDDRDLVGGAATLKRFMQEDELWDVYQLRAMSMLQSRVYKQLQRLFETQDAVEAMDGDEDVRASVWMLAIKLRRLEFELLERGYEWFEHEKEKLAQTANVKRYLESVNAPEEELEERTAEQGIAEVEAIDSLRQPFGRSTPNVGLASQTTRETGARDGA